MAWQALALGQLGAACAAAAAAAGPGTGTRQPAGMAAAALESFKEKQWLHREHLGQHEEGCDDYAGDDGQDGQPPGQVASTLGPQLGVSAELTIGGRHVLP